MITFVIKSALCLTILYGFYHLFLRNIKAFDFNRFYLLFSLLFAIVIPLITIRISLNLPVNSNIHEFSIVTGSLIQGEKIDAEPIHFLTFQETLIILYFIISSILLLRFVLNIYKIIKLICASRVVNNFKTQIVLVENKTLPYSFFRYIFVNLSDYENGKIEKELIIHEQAHCLQYHSVDILIVELVKIILWFNPLLWLFRKAIQLNHEFLADNKVLSNYDLNDYQNTLINLVFRNNSTYLASNFNYSLTKKRLFMMTKNDSSNKAMYRKVAAISLFLILAITLTFSQKIVKKDNVVNSHNYENILNRSWTNMGYLDMNKFDNSLYSITIGRTQQSSAFENKIFTDDLGFLEKNSTYKLSFLIKASRDFTLILHYGEEDITKSLCTIHKKVELKADEDFARYSFEFNTNETIPNAHIVFGMGYAPVKTNIILTSIGIEKVK